MSEANPCPTCGYQIDRVERLNTENARLRAALAWIDNTDPEMVAAAEDKFGFNLVVEQKETGKP